MLHVFILIIACVVSHVGQFLHMLLSRMRFKLLVNHFSGLKARVSKRILFIILKFALISKFYTYLTKYIASTRVVKVKL